MNRWTISAPAIILCLAILLGCSGNAGNPAAPESDINPVVTSSSGQASQTGTFLGAYYDCFVDVENESIEVVRNRTAEYTLNLVPFLNMVKWPLFGLAFTNVSFDQSDPSVLGVDLNFEISHPLAGNPQYNAYDLRGVIIGHGRDWLSYDPELRYGVSGVDLTMKNPDGYTRWFNPVEFPTELIFGWAPGGYQDLVGSGSLNPYKYYAMGLTTTGNAFNFLASGSNNDGLFQDGLGRRMELEFVYPPNGVGISFGYAVVLAWEEQGSGPYTPYHITEAAAAYITQTDSLYYNPGEGSGGILILDIDLYCWQEQPDWLYIESTVLSFGFVPKFNAANHLLGNIGNAYRYHVEIPSQGFTGTQGHECWVFAEYENFDYKNNNPGIPSPDVPLAAAFRIPLNIVDNPFCPDVVVTGIDLDNITPEIDDYATQQPYPDVKVSGTGFTGTGLNSEIFFIGTGPITGTDIQAGSVNVITSIEMTCSVDFTGAPLGEYAVQVINGCGKSGQSATALVTVGL
jgi:hypothetical protein